MMKLLGLGSGRKMGNSEVLLREALMAAEKTGVKIELLRLHDLHIKPCIGCISCSKDQQSGGTGECVIKDDDMPFFNEKLLGCDGIILSIPVYIMTPPGHFKVLCDRIGPSHDVAWQMEAKRIAESEGRESKIDPRFFKPRVGAFIAVGGAPTPDWLSLALPLMNTFTFPMQIEVIDQMQVLGSPLPGQVVLNDVALERARRLGRHVAEAMGKPLEQLEWKGDEPGTCPVCHSNVMLVGKTKSVECAVCGIRGELKERNGEITVTFSKEQQAISRLTLAGKKLHFDDVVETVGKNIQAMGEVQARLKKYQTLKAVKPSKAKKNLS
ncbi:MAG: flavodoxin family protein [Deltaproteobacteria bacterium]|nr:flavodoxin family protein [Deltaproteobacteria bacterium]